MASWQEISRLRSSAAEVQTIAKRLLVLSADVLTEWETGYLTSIAHIVRDNDLTARQSKKLIEIRDRRRTADPQDLTTRQSEKLLQIRDGVERISTFFGFSIETLLQQCYEARLDLDADDEDWIIKTRNKNPATILRRDAGRLMRCARQLNVIEVEYE